MEDRSSLWLCPSLPPCLLPQGSGGGGCALNHFLSSGNNKRREDLESHRSPQTVSPGAHHTGHHRQYPLGHKRILAPLDLDYNVVGPDGRCLLPVLQGTWRTLSTQLGSPLQEACALSSHQLFEHPTFKDWSFFIFMPSAQMCLEILGSFKLHLSLAMVLCIFEGNIQKMRQYLSSLASHQLTEVSPGLCFILFHVLCPGGLGDLSPAVH